MIGMAEEYIKEGFDGFISKPIQTSQLNAILTKHIKNKQSPEVIEAAKASKAAKFAGDINSFQDDPELLSKLREDFAKRHGNTFENICNALNTGDIKTAHRLVHTIKGLAGLIYENTLMETANETEQELAANNHPTNARLTALQTELTRVLADIGETQKTSTSEYVTPREVPELLEELTPLLSSRNTQCLNLLGRLRKIPQADLLCSQIENFDFGPALETLGELKRSLTASA
jgi:HPt (histidine-containing phosphotransfer) domain-containing protein